MRFLFSGGDGDQEWLGEDFIAERVHERWFPDKLERGPAYLLKIITGRRKGGYLAITSRVVGSLEEQLAKRDYISVVVHSVLGAGPDFIPTAENIVPVGMAAIEVERPASSILKNPWS